MTTPSAPPQAERPRRRALLVAGRVADGHAKFAPPPTSGRSRLVPPSRPHHATNGYVDVGHRDGKLPEPCDLGFRALRAVNGVADSATPFAPGLLVTVGENFPHRVTRGFRAPACGDGGAKCAPPCDRGFCRTVPQNLRSRSQPNEGGKFPPPSPLLTAVPNRHPRGLARRPARAGRCPVDKSAYSISTRRKILDVVVARSHLTSMTSTQHTTTTPEPPTSGDASKSFGARLARRSREAQGLPPVIADPRIRERLRSLCVLPKPGASGVPDELDSAGE